MALGNLADSSPTAAQRFHQFLDESRLRVIALGALALLAVLRGIRRTSHVTRQVRIRVLELRLGRCRWCCRFQTPALTFRWHSAGGAWPVARFPSSRFRWRWGRGLRGV